MSLVFGIPAAVLIGAALTGLALWMDRNEGTLRRKQLRLDNTDPVFVVAGYFGLGAFLHFLVGVGWEGDFESAFYAVLSVSAMIFFMHMAKRRPAMGLITSTAMLSGTFPLYWSLSMHCPSCTNLTS